MLEMTYVLPIVLLIVFAGLGMLWLSYNAIAMQFIVNYSIREAVVRDCIGSQPNTELSDIKDGIQQYSRPFGIGLDDNDISIRSCRGTNISNCTSDSVGQPGDMVDITIGYDVPVLYPFSVYRLTAVAIGRNERVVIDKSRCPPGA